MDETLSKEIEYLKNKCSEVSYHTERFKLFIGEDRYLMGVISPKGQSAPYSKLMQYKTIHDTLIDLDYKIKLSFNKGIEYAYSEPVQKHFNMVGSDETEEEKLAYYYIENALFRTSSLWDILAQLYCLFYNIEIPKDKIYYNYLFKRNTKYYKDNKINKNKINRYDEFIKQVNNIKSYLNEEDTELPGEWKGNHKYTVKWRNKMTHRNSPNVTTMSDFDFNLKSHPTYMLKRIIDDYSVVSKYIDEILNVIEKEVTKDFKQE